MSLENIFGAVVLLGIGLVILLHPDKFRYSSKQISSLSLDTGGFPYLYFLVI